MLPVSHPGRLLRRELDARGLSASGLARALGVSSGRVTDILSGRRSISADTAVRLGLNFGNDAAFRSGLRNRYDTARAERERGAGSPGLCAPPTPHRPPRPPHRWTAPMHAANKGRILMVAPLLAAQVNPDVRAADGATALFTAAAHGHTEIVVQSMKAGADISLKGPKDRRAADIARRGHGNAASGTAGGPGAAAIPSGFLCKRRANIRETLERRPGSNPGSTALVPGSPCGRPGRHWGASRIGSARFLYLSRSGKSRVRRVRPAPVVRHEFYR